MAATQPGAYCKILTLLVPRELKLEHRNIVADLTDEQLERMIAELDEKIARRAAGDQAKLIEGTVETTAATAPPAELGPPKRRSNRLMMEADTAIGPRGAQAEKAQAAVAAERVISVPPKVLEPVGRHLGVPDGMLDVLVPEVMLQGPRVVAVVRELETTGMTEHVGVDWEWHLGGLAEALDEPMETDGADWPPALGNEYVSILWGNRGVACAALASRHRGSGAHLGFRP